MNNINIGLIVDRSGSVENEKIALENSINLLIESFKRKYKESINLNVLLVILESDDLSIQDNNLKNINLEKIGLKDKSIKETLEIIEEKFEKLEGNRFLNQRKRSKENEIEYISVGIGEGYRKIILEKFSTNGVIFEYQDVYDFI